MDDKDAEYEFEVWQNDEMQAGGSGPAEMVIAEAGHYAMMYGQDGETEIKYFVRRQITEAELTHSTGPRLQSGTSGVELSQNQAKAIR